jgi:cytochrome c oxidase subunit 2
MLRLKPLREVTALSRQTQRSRRALSTFLLFLLLGFLLSGCQLALDQSTLNPAGDMAQTLENLFLFIFWLAVAVFVVVQALLIVVLVRFRQRKGHEQDIPVQTHGNTPLEIAWTIAPAIIVIAITIPTIQNIAPTYAAPANVVAEEGGDQMTIEVIGHQWWWEFRYLDSAGEVDFVTANEMHIPINTIVNLNLTSEDVIHSFWVPRLAGTRDVIPGRQNTLWLNANEPGVYPGACKELCGLSHALMRHLVIAETPQDYETWAVLQRQPVTIAADRQAGWELFQSKGCVGCHAIEGTEAQGDVGPDLTHFGSRTTIAANALEKTLDDETLARWLRNPSEVKPGALMPDLNLTEQEISTVVGFLESLE